MTAFEIKSYFAQKKKIVEEALSRWMPEKAADPARLHESMYYSLFADGKRVRPILTLAAAEVAGLAQDDVLPLAAALEMIHVFSLIHDDLPAMDDDDLRRGQPTNHKVYGDAVAILAGDALLAQAFVPLCGLNAKKFGAANVLAVIRMIAEATGSPGMIGGQFIDLESEGKKVPLERLKTLHRMKTGALIRAAVVAPAVLAGTEDAVMKGLEEYGDAIGLAFQIADDILDIEGGAEIGKDVGSDVENGKSTYPALMGLDGAKKERSRMMDKAFGALAEFDSKADALRAIARFIVERKK
jgi:geranylgeranyl diphosphate synthase type II